MVRYTLEDLTKELAAKPQLAERLFTYHASNGRYGPAAAAAINVPEAGRNYVQRATVATAQAIFNAQRNNPANNQVLLRTYLPDYSRERNQRSWNDAKWRAAGLGIGGLAWLLLGLGIDSKPAKVLAEAAGVAILVGSPAALGIAYLKYRA